MTGFDDLVRRRRMTRRFATRALPDGSIDHLVDLASRSPSAGKTQGWHLVVLEGEDTARFWDVTLPVERRDGFRWQELLDAPAILLPFADAAAYTERYAHADKAATGLGTGPDAWPVPYWTIDTSMAVMTILLGAEDAGLGALFFGVFSGEAELRRRLGVPHDLELLGAIALGVPLDARPTGTDDSDRGRSAERRRRTPEEIIHRGGWDAGRSASVPAES